MNDLTPDLLGQLQRQIQLLEEENNRLRGELLALRGLLTRANEMLTPLAHSLQVRKD
jgi:hypothetical protein